LSPVTLTGSGVLLNLHGVPINGKTVGFGQPDHNH
jgi:hypothetical protein